MILLSLLESAATTSAPEAVTLADQLIGRVFPFIFGYSLGAIPFGLILTRLAGLGDIRSIGSGNIGATNVLRTGNKKLAAGTLLLDALKGTAAVLIGSRVGRASGSKPTLRFSAGSAPSLAISSRCGSGSAAAKVLRPTSACFWASSGLPR